MPTVAAERRAFGDVLEGLAESDWDAPSLCAGWRVREVVAHMTMPFRYSAPRFLGEMVRSRGNFARMADRVARRDAQAPIGTLLDGWRTNDDHPWKPPGGGLEGALTHDVVHGLDITVPLRHRAPGRRARPARRPRPRDDPAEPEALRSDLTGIRLEADDLDWTWGDGEPLRGRARHLLLVLMDRRLRRPSCSPVRPPPGSRPADPGPPVRQEPGVPTLRLHDPSAASHGSRVLIPRGRGPASGTPQESGPRRRTRRGPSWPRTTRTPCT